MQHQIIILVLTSLAQLLNLEIVIYTFVLICSAAESVRGDTQSLQHLWSLVLRVLGHLSAGCVFMLHKPD